MLEKGKIAARQFAILATLYIVGSAILLFPTMLASKAKQDAWLSAIVAVCIGLLAVSLYVALGKRFPNKTFAEYSELIVGKWLGKAATLSFLLFAVFIATVSLRNIGAFLTDQILTETPIEVIYIMVMAVVAMGVRLGLETFSRAAELFFPWITMLFITLVLLAVPQMKMVHLQPVLEWGGLPILQAAIPSIHFPFVESAVLLMIYPFVNKSRKSGKAFLTGVLLGGIMLTVITLLCIAVLGPVLTAENRYPSYIIAKTINIGNFLQRIEAIMAIIWFLTIYFKLCVLLYAMSLGISQTFRCREYRFLTIPLAGVIIPFTIIEIPNSTYLLQFNQTIMPFYTFTFGLLLPLLLYAVALVRRKKS